MTTIKTIKIAAGEYVATVGEGLIASMKRADYGWWLRITNAYGEQVSREYFLTFRDAKAKAIRVFRANQLGSCDYPDCLNTRMAGRPWCDLPEHSQENLVKHV